VNKASCEKKIGFKEKGEDTSFTKEKKNRKA